MSSRMGRIGGATFLVAMLLCQQAYTAEIILWTKGFAGNLPGIYSHVTYTITASNEISLTNVCDTKTYDMNYLWERDPMCSTPGSVPGDNYINTVSPADWVSSIEFSEAVPINVLSTMIVDFNKTDSTDTITVESTSGATPADLVVAPKTDGTAGPSVLFNPNNSGQMSYDPMTGIVLHQGYMTVNSSGTPSNRGDLHLIGNSTTTITKLTHTIDISDNSDATILNYGFRQIAVPEPAPFWLLGSVIIGHACISRWRSGASIFPLWL